MYTRPRAHPVHGAVGAPGSAKEVASRVSPGDRAGLGARACPEYVCARPGVRARDRCKYIIRSRGSPGPCPQRPSPASPTDTHQTAAAAGAGRGGPRPQSFPAVRTGGVLGPEAAASASPSLRLGLRSQLAGGGLHLKRWGRGWSGRGPSPLAGAGRALGETLLPSRPKRSFGEAS